MWSRPLFKGELRNFAAHGNSLNKNPVVSLWHEGPYIMLDVPELQLPANQDHRTFVMGTSQDCCCRVLKFRILALVLLTPFSATGTACEEIVGVGMWSVGPCTLEAPLNPKYP